MIQESVPDAHEEGRARRQFTRRGLLASAAAVGTAGAVTTPRPAAAQGSLRQVPSIIVA